MTVPIATARAALYERLKSHTAGAAVRAATGPASAAGVIPAHKLRETPRPVRPFVAGRAGVINGTDGEMRDALITWWIYDDPAQGYVRIDALIDLIRAAYPEDAIDYGRTRPGVAGQQGEDSALGGLLMCPITVTYRRLS